MARNIEIKARITSVDAVAPIAAALATRAPIEIAQDDTFFRCESGRLKLRTFSPTEGELIFYQRANERGPKESFYVRAPTSSPGTLREALSLAYGQVGRVVKHRTLYLVGRTRVHLDQVDGLGHFLELEVVLEEGEPTESGIREAHMLIGQLGIETSALIDTAYVDLIAQRALSAHAGEHSGATLQESGRKTPDTDRIADRKDEGSLTTLQRHEPAP